MEPAVVSAPEASGSVPSETDWAAFVETFGRAILEWLRGQRISAAEAHGVTRELIQSIGQDFVAMTPGTRFRTWLRHVGHKAWCQMMESRVEGVTGQPSSPVLNLLLSVEAHDAFLNALETWCTEERHRLALARVTGSAEPQDWEAFYLVVVEQMALAEVARELQLSELAVHGSVFRVNRLLKCELEQMGND